MTTHVIFHELETALDFEVNIFTSFACELIAKQFDSTKNISVFCANLKDAEALDEKLWQLPVEKFIPHNLFNEGDGKASPVEIIVFKDGEISKQIRNKACLVNFSEEIAPNASMFPVIYEFVPSDDTSKANARLRYSEYKRAGFALSFLKTSDVA